MEVPWFLAHLSLHFSTATNQGLAPLLHMEQGLLIHTAAAHVDPALIMIRGRSSVR